LGPLAGSRPQGAVLAPGSSLPTYRSMPPAEPHTPQHARRRGRTASKQPRSRTTRTIVGAVLIVIVGGGAALGASIHADNNHVARRGASTTRASATHATTTTVTTVAPTTTTTIPTTTTTIPGQVAATACTPTTVAGGVYAVGDSVMLDTQQLLQECVSNIQVNAAVSRQWSDGETVLRQVMAGASPPSVVVVALGTNGPISSADFDAMMSILHGATRVVFVTVHVDKPWQGPVNGVLVSGVARYPNAVLADWQGLASSHPEWFYSDGTHLPINGAGAQALAGLIASKV
jgi:hypothetical protein